MDLLSQCISIEPQYRGEFELGTVSIQPCLDQGTLEKPQLLSVGIVAFNACVEIGIDKGFKSFSIYIRSDQLT